MAESPRRTLTDEVRRAMCQYAAENEGAKQTEIGARFGVERSTVSKVLRHKDKYLNLEERSSSPVRRTGKGRGTNIEKALENYLKNKKGKPPSREEIWEKARLFAAMAQGESHDLKAIVDKLMSKHGIARLMRRASEANIPDRMRASGSRPLTPSQPSSAISPASPSGQLSPICKKDGEKERMNGFADFTTNGVYKHSSSQSTTSLSSPFSDAATPSFPGSAISPTSSFHVSPDPNAGVFLTGDHGLHGGPGPSFQRPRSQTFPTLDLEYLNQNQSAEPATPKYYVPSTAPPSALESAGTDANGPVFNFEHAVSPPPLRHSSSNGSIAGRSSTTPITNSTVGSTPGSPTQEDAHRAANTLLSYFTNGGGLVDQNDYIVLMRLTDKLRIHQSQLAKTAAHGMGGLSRIPEGDSEMPNAPPSLMKME
ncbi:hypothetical protein N0V88_002022 [Collariella sp. IMI 366227]|nr:hypothetical protein N0V88_002022 [Collariella sp. IMI 366227]